MDSVCGFALGSILAVASGALAVGTCCKPVANIGNGDGGAPCTGKTVKVCEESPEYVLKGKVWSQTYREAECSTYISDQIVLQHPCDSPNPPGAPWQLVPGSMPDGGMCCYRSGYSNPTITKLAFQIRPCRHDDCEPANE